MPGHRIAVIIVMLESLAALPAFGHHSSAAYDTDQTLEISGTVAKYSFRNPHVYMTLTVANPDGSTHDIEIEAGAASVIAPLGFTREAVAVGDAVTVIGNPNRRDPDALLLGRELYKTDGTYYPLNISSRSTGDFGNAVATSIEGTWFPPRTSFFGFLGGANAWSLTPAGQAAADTSTPLSTTHKDCIPIGIPGLMVYPVADTIAIFDDRVVMDIDWLDSVRTIWLDGRDHPDAAQTFLFGHSTGHFDGTTLVAETTNFTEHGMGLTMSLPGSAQRKIEERFELSEDGKQMIYSGVITDPVYLAEPVAWSNTWIYRPGMAHANESCDLDVARKFLDD